MQPFYPLVALISLAIGSLGAPPPAAAQGPSFDCARASTAVEGAICNSSTLAALDRQLADAYSARRAGLGSSGRDRLLAEQRSWLGARDRCGADANCLAGAMRRRIAALEEGGPGTRAARAPAAAPVSASYMGRWKPYGREADFFSAMTLSPTRLAYDSGLVFELRQVRSESNVFQVLAKSGWEPGICSDRGPTHIGFTLTSDGFLQLHHFNRQSAPPDLQPLTPQNMGSGPEGLCSVGSYTR